MIEGLRMHYTTTAFLALLAGTTSAAVGDWQQCTLFTSILVYGLTSAQAVALVGVVKQHAILVLDVSR